MPYNHSKNDDSGKLVEILHKLAKKLSPKKIKIMEVCGTHTVTAQASGLHSLLPENITLISGPGCPVCVTPAGYLQQAIDLALEGKAHITTYGDMIRVPGAEMSLEDARRQGAKVSVVYSVQQTLEEARKNPNENFIFLGIGFETTTPPSAFAVKKAIEEKLDNFMVFSAHKLVLPVMKTLLLDPRLDIDGFIAPGHVSIIIGSNGYEEIASVYERPCVVAGFDGNQMLIALTRILTQILDGKPMVENVYRDRVKAEGNIEAQKLIAEVFEPASTRWRGMGMLPNSGLEFREEFATHDARKVFNLPEPQDYEPKGCLCADVIKGITQPPNCPLFGNRCTPTSPVGACMVSREGSCSAYYRYREVK